jgi:steroid delta-isomerase-like uncharacterized protein
MSTETNKAIVSRYIEQVWNNGRLEQIDNCFVEEIAGHTLPQIPGLNGRDTLKAVIGGARESLPDIQLTLLDVIGAGDKVVTRWEMIATHQHEFMGVPATGKQLTQSGAAIYRLTDGKIVELWNFPDNLGLMQQLGIIPTPETAR